ncbi:MAG: SpoIIE family protein phosphatase [Phycisphaerales bacterium]|nr:SpoIIE family protein phosphatase [Phycisphaerales bacterium]MCB9836024.1 SpoIIE family protein phosphatase [Phycisphaera sp.]
MRLRNKLFFILVAIAIIPLIATGILARINVRKCSTSVATDTRTRVEQIVEVARTRYVRQYAATFDRDRILIESTVRTAADLLEQIDLLESATPGVIHDPSPVYFAADYSDPERAPKGMTFDDNQYIQNDDGSHTPIPISRDYPVFVTVITDPAEISSDVRKLGALTRTLSTGTTLPTGESWLLSHYASLEATGTHISYPGKGGYPAGYDPRTRPWYTKAAASDEPATWIGPIVDAPTGQVRMTCAAPARRHDGSLIGVVAADVLMINMLDEIELPKDMQGQVKIMLVTLDDTGALIHAKAEYAEQGGRSRDPIKLDYLTADDEAQTKALLDQMGSTDDGNIEFTIDGEEWILSYQRLLRGDSFVVVAITRETIDSVADNVQSEVYSVFNDTIASNAGIGGIVIAAAVGVAFFGARSVTRPVHSLVDTASAIASGDLDATATVRTGDELQQLADAFNDMVPKLRDQLAVRESLMLAKEVQQNLLPSEPPAIPGLDIASRSIYCDETGGDYLDFFPVEGEAGKHAFFVADVTGHGIAAALLMTTARALLRTRAIESDEIATVLTRVNADLARDARSGHFMTLYYLLIEPESRTAHWASAGHDPAIVYTPSTDTFTEFAGNDIPLGIEPAWDFHEFEAPLPAEGGVVVIGTDGIWEARNAQDELFGKDRLRETIKANAHKPADDIASDIIKEVIAFRDGAPQTDDITLLVLKVTA